MNTNPRKSHKYKPTAYLILSILWMLLIFSFGAAGDGIDQDKSTRRHDGRKCLSTGFFLPCQKLTGQSMPRASSSRCERPPMRRSMPFLVFYLQPLCHPLKKRHYGLWGWLLGTGYAATDEIHRLFVPGRKRASDGCHVR